MNRQKQLKISIMMLLIFCLSQAAFPQPKFSSWFIVKTGKSKILLAAANSAADKGLDSRKSVDNSKKAPKKAVKSAGKEDIPNKKNTASKKSSGSADMHTASSAAALKVAKPSKKSKAKADKSKEKNVILGHAAAAASSYFPDASGIAAKEKDENAVKQGAATSAPATPVSPAPADACAVAHAANLPPAIELDVDKSISIALQNNPDIKAAQARVEQAIGKYHEARSALNFRLNGQGSYTRLYPTTSIMLPVGPNGEDVPVNLTEPNNFAGSLILQKVITTFGRLEYTIAAAGLQVASQEASLDTAKQNVTFRTQEAYINVLKAQGGLKIAQENLRISNDQLTLTNQLFQAGIVPRFEVLRSELMVSRAKQAVIVAENGIENADAAFLTVLGLDVNTPLILKEEKIEENIKISLDCAQALAMKNRPEIKAALLARQALINLVEAAKRTNSPDLVFNSNYTYKTAAGLSPNPNNWATTFAINIPLEDGGLTRARTEQACGNLHELEQTLAGLLLNIKLDVQQSVLSVEETQARIDAARKDVETTQEGYAIALTRYQNGISTGLELEDALRNLNTARINLLNVQYEYYVALARVARATATKIECLKGGTND